MFRNKEAHEINIKWDKKQDRDQLIPSCMIRTARVTHHRSNSQRKEKSHPFLRTGNNYKKYLLIEKNKVKRGLLTFWLLFDLGCGSKRLFCRGSSNTYFLSTEFCACMLPRSPWGCCLGVLVNHFVTPLAKTNEILKYVPQLNFGALRTQALKGKTGELGTNLSKC